MRTSLALALAAHQSLGDRTQGILSLVNCCLMALLFSVQSPSNADEDLLPEPAMSPNCLPGLSLPSLPRVFSSRDKPHPQRIVPLLRPTAGSSVRKELLPPPPLVNDPVPEGSPAHGASLASPLLPYTLRMLKSDA